jgi:hypothetical protein
MMVVYLKKEKDGKERDGYKIKEKIMLKSMNGKVNMGRKEIKM